MPETPKNIWPSGIDGSTIKDEHEGEPGEQQVKKLACIICGGECTVKLWDDCATILQDEARRIFKSDFLKEWAEANGYRKIDPEKTDAINAPGCIGKFNQGSGDCMDCNQRGKCEARQRQIWEQIDLEKLLTFAERCLELAQHGDYSNGNVAEGIDEGDVLANKLLKELEVQLAHTKQELRQQLGGEK
jgi:hypothetical protein